MNRAPRLTVAMIVRNESNTICRSLDSIKGIADQIVVFDTSDDDSTAEAAEGRTPIGRGVPKPEPPSGLRTIGNHRRTGLDAAVASHDSTRRTADAVGPSASPDASVSGMR